MAKALIFLWFVYASTISISTMSHARHETISGQIIAYANPLECLNGNAYWAMIIHVQSPKDVPAKFIRVNFSLPCEESPRWLSAKPSLQKFRLIRDKSSDGALKEFMGSVDASTGQENKQFFPIWKHLPGTEDEKLPFGQVLPSYRSIDLPLAPLL